MPNQDLGKMSLRNAANLAAGNWQRFDSFVWWKAKKLADADKWFIYYGRHRESGLLDKSNSQQIAEALTPFMEGSDADVAEENHNHWAVGWIAGWSIRVYRGRKITKAFRVLHELMQRLADYPILNESHYSEMELDAAYENIPHAAWKLQSEFDLPPDWVDDVYSWLSENNCAALENTDDQGGYPCEDELREAFIALGFTQLDLAG